MEISKTVTSILALSALLNNAGCSKQAPPEPIATPVRVEAAQSLSDDALLRYSAQVVPQTQVDVAFRTDGYIDTIKLVPGVESRERLLQAGDSVSTGDIMARVQDEQYRDQLTKAEADLDKALAAARKADQDYQRAQALNETQSITGPDFDAAQKEYATANAAVKAARAQLDEANLKLEETALIAPLDGIVQQRNIEIGTLVRNGTVGFVVANTNTVKVVFGVPDTVLGDVRLGSRLKIETASLPDRTFNGEVTEITPAADQRTRIFEVSVSVDNADGALRPGMIASLELDTSAVATQQVLVVPVNAMVEGPDNSFALYIVTKNGEGQEIASLRTVEAGQIMGNRVTVTGNIKSGDQVIVTGTAQ
ncbi:MAG: efflux RND transporter periplasmic adaptor subunit, partial [Pseudomonadota bacterium]